jgi:hypothetical protein
MADMASTAAVNTERERFFWHWQNLNERKDGTQGLALRQGRCWWHFPRNRSIEFDWNLWTHFCGVSLDWDDEDATLKVAFPPIALWLSFSSSWSVLKRLLPHRVLSPNYPTTIVVDERDIGIDIHSGSIWIKPYCRKNEWRAKDPWWERGITMHVHPERSAQSGWGLCAKWRIAQAGSCSR